MIENFDQAILDKKRVDPAFNESILSQVLRIAVYDEFHAYEAYLKIIEKFGNQQPFNNILEAEKQHYSMLIDLMEKYQIEIPINDWAEKIVVPNTFQEACELGVASEIENIRMYDNLVSFTTQEDVKDVLYRLQAASYNNHLPAFRESINNIYNQNNNLLTNLNQEEIMGKVSEFQDVATKFANGEIDQNALMNILQKSNFSFIGGLLLGALGSYGVSKVMNKDNEIQEDEEEI